MKSLARAGSLLLIALLFAGPTGCTSGDSGGSSAPGAKRIIFVTNGQSPYWDACRAGLQAAEKELKLGESGLSAEMQVNDGTPAGQIAKLRQFASQGDVVAVGISVTDSKVAGIADELRELQAKGIHVVACDADIDRSKNSDARFGFIGTDNTAAGRELGVAIKNLRPDGGEMVTFVGITGSQNAIERRDGVVAGAGDKFKLADHMGDEMDSLRAQENVRNAMTNHPQAKTLVGLWSYNGPAIVHVVEERGKRSEYTVVTFDAEQASIREMAHGQIDCLLVQNPYEIGYQSVRLMKALVTKDDATVKEMFPKHGQPGGDIFEIGVKLVVPDDKSPLKKEMFGPKTEFLTLEKFKAWLAKYGLSCS